MTETAVQTDKRDLFISTWLQSSQIYKEIDGIFAIGLPEFAYVRVIRLQLLARTKWPAKTHVRTTLVISPITDKTV